MIYGPRLIGDTSDRSGIFRILAALDAIRSWGEDIYYPWLRSHILMPLAGRTDQGTTTATATSNSAPSDPLGHGGQGDGKGKGRA